MPHPRKPIVLYRHALSDHCHRVELFIRMLGLPLALVDVTATACGLRAA